jgi:hydrogenase-4 component E
MTPITPLSFSDTVALSTAFIGVMMVGSTHLRVNLWLFSCQTTVLAAYTALCAQQLNDSNLMIVAVVLFVLKALFVPNFLSYIIRKVNVQRDSGILVPTPLAMHLCLAFIVISYLLARQLPPPVGETTAWPTATAAISMVCTGLVLMLTRRVALGQIVGFLVMENGIYLFGLVQTRGMPVMIEMGIMLDLIAAIMIAGLIVFRISKNFEHIDVSMLSELKE